jgi:hypothetical protein
MWASSSERKYRIPLASGSVASRSWSHSALSTMSCDRSASSCGSVGRGVPVVIRSAISTRRFVPIRQGIVLPHASVAQNAVSSRPRSTTQARSSATTTEPEPTWAPTARRASNS